MIKRTFPVNTVWNLPCGLATQQPSSGACTLQEFDIAVLQDDEQEQHRVLTQCQETPGFSAENMLKLAETSQQAAKNHLDVTKTAYSAAQKLLLSMGHAVPYDKVALVRRFAGSFESLALQAACSTLMTAAVCLLV